MSFKNATHDSEAFFHSGKEAAVTNSVNNDSTLFQVLYQAMTVSLHAQQHSDGPGAA